MAAEKPQLKDMIQARAKGGRISCAEALAIARECGVPAPKVRELLDAMGIRVVKCQLGCFE